MEENDNTISIETLIQQAQAGTNKFHCNTLEDNVAATKETVDKLVTDSKVAVKDHYGNKLTSVGNDDKVESFTQYGFSNDTLNYPLWLALYNDSWVFRRAIDKPAQDEINCGFVLHGTEDYTKVYKAYERYKHDLTQLLMWGALFGGSIAVMMFDGISDEEMSLPLNKEKIKNKRMRLYVTDRWYGVSCTYDDLVTNMKDIDYGKPKYYDITFADGHSIKVHHSYILRYEHRTAPRLIKSSQLMGWGYAEGSHIINELSRDDQLKSSITSLVNKSLIEVIKMSGMRGVFMGTDKGNEQQLRKRLEMVNWGRTYNSLTFLDKDDEYQQYQLSGLAGLADLLEKNMWLISAALEMQGILYGDLKGGLSQESDALRRYAITILNRCNAYVRPVLTKFLKILFIVYDIKGSPDFDFNSLVKDEDNTNKTKAISDMSQMLAKLFEDGIISKYQYAKTMSDFINDNVVNITFTEEQLDLFKLEEEKAMLDSIKELSKSNALKNRAENIGSSFGGTPSSSGLPSGDFEQEDIGSEQSVDIGENTNEVPEVQENTETAEQSESTEV